ncbi:hypothetical protein [Qipengyuania sp.]|uniref:hypothetical protein n=1 Tax=Qipengyuania sp. TaxID=2004515 RepID=UPI003735B903
MSACLSAFKVLDTRSGRLLFVVLLIWLVYWGYQAIIHDGSQYVEWCQRQIDEVHRQNLASGVYKQFPYGRLSDRRDCQDYAERLWSFSDVKYFGTMIIGVPCIVIGAALTLKWILAPQK